MERIPIKTFKIFIFTKSDHGGCSIVDKINVQFYASEKSKALH